MAAPSLNLPKRENDFVGNDFVTILGCPVASARDAAALPRQEDQWLVHFCIRARSF
jgi:hypothetical protein